MKRILIIEDDESIAAIERDYLTVNEFEVDIAATGPEGIALGRTGQYDLILLDVMIPGMDGFSVCRTLRKELDIPIIMVTARLDDIDKIRGLGLGADGYITKPFSPNVLIAHVKANLAQYARLKGKEGRSSRSELVIGEIRVNTDSHRVYVRGREVELKNKEYELLLFLMKNADIVFSREDLYERIWGYDALGDNATVSVHINRLREKIERDLSHPEYIVTVRGAGYRFRGAEEYAE
ncbi:MAG: response regulator transcription factor [Clostridia bacterium]